MEEDRGERASRTSSRPPTPSACRPIYEGKIGLTRGQAGAKQAVDQQFARWVMLHGAGVG